ncbi:hypothetical protein FB451DRAFT_1501207 [Mycena latifolia]|nr:hypothetical protein FB451DRAFT_1501207 [Mycena latifolia]
MSNCLPVIIARCGDHAGVAATAIMTTGRARSEPTYITPRKVDVVLTPVPRPGMSCLSGTSLSLLASAPPPTSTAANILLGALVFTAAAYTVYYTSPTRLTPILVAAIAETEKTYFEALEAGVLPKSDADTATTLTSLQIKVSNIREVTLRHSLSYRATLGAFLTGHSFTVLHCIRDVRRLEIHIEAHPERSPLARRRSSVRKRDAHGLDPPTP